ncbi:MAG TPA: glycosyltransferase [Gammaproteobacteria bacterium]|nr:glycosyltransferase [Gammaproteobacteria bacterium]
MTVPLISLVIATFNRARLIREALDSVAASTIEPASLVEVIVVDNNSTDDTAAVIAAIRDKGYPFPLKYVLETNQGTSHARNRGISEAHGKYVVFMDDDQRIDPAYLANVEAVFQETGAACVGGPVYYYNAKDIPHWLAPILKHKGQVNHGDSPRTLEVNGPKLGGGNIAFERDALAAIGPYDVRLGHHGDALGGSEDWEIQDRAIEQGYVVAYHPKLIQYHYLRPERYRKHYWRKLYFAYGRSLYLRNDWRTANLFLGAPRVMWWFLLTRDFRRLVRAWLTLDRAHTFEKQLGLWLQAGKIYAARQARHGR